LNPEEKTIAGYLKDLGYTTGLVGKWHCGDQPEFLPTRHGFDHYFGLPYSNDMSRMTQAHCPIPLPLLRDEEILQLQPDQAALTERYVSECVEFLRKNKERPFFLYLAHMHVHLPLIVAERFLKQSENGPYGAAVECVDWAADVLVKELQRLGIDENTILIFTSDNGSKGINGGSNLPLRGHKGTAWEGGFRVPFLVRWPGKIRPGSISNELMTGMDLLPTLVNLAGGSVDPKRTIDGLDFSDHLLGKSESGPREDFLYYFIDRLCAIRSGRWKLHLFSTERESRPVCELYDLVNDPAESSNLAAENPDVVQELTSRLEAARLRLGDSLTGISGSECRPAGRVANPKTLAEYDPEHPYMIAAYDGGIG
jgi:arylsulfatase A-like enzyme